MEGSYSTGVTAHLCLLLTHSYTKTSTNWNWWPKNLLKTVDPEVLYIHAFDNSFVCARWEGDDKEAPELMLSLLLLKQWDFCGTKWWKKVFTARGLVLRVHLTVPWFLLSLHSLCFQILFQWGCYRETSASFCSSNHGLQSCSTNHSLGWRGREVPVKADGFCSHLYVIYLFIAFLLSFSLPDSISAGQWFRLGPGAHLYGLDTLILMAFFIVPLPAWSLCLYLLGCRREIISRIKLIFHLNVPFFIMYLAADCVSLLLTFFSILAEVSLAGSYLIPESSFRNNFRAIPMNKKHFCSRKNKVISQDSAKLFWVILCVSI